MAATPEGAALTESNRRRQLALRAALTSDLVTLWRSFDIGDVDGSWQSLAPAVTTLTTSARRDSAVLAASYFSDFRQAEGATGTFRPRPVWGVNPDAVATSLRVTGPVAFKRAISAGITPQQASSQALVSTTGAVSRIALDGGRNTIDGNVRRDSTALGWARVTDGAPCAFCAMLASRGAVYRSEFTAMYRGDGGKYHDHCGCSAEPIYRKGAALPGRASEFSDLWAESTRGLSGNEARIAFRRAYEGRA